jgi:hypothetical protein
MTLQDMRDALRGQNKANEAIFWFCLAWNQGPESDLYRIMIETHYDPFFNKQHQISTDPEILYCFDVLGKMYERAFGVPVEWPLQRIKFDDLKEDDIIIAEACWPCIQAGWPCKVYKWHGALGVACVDSPDKRAFHGLEPTSDGYVKGFRR